MQNMSSQSLCTFSEEVGVASGCGQVMAEGRVSHKADIQPPSSEVYMKLKGYVYGKEDIPRFHTLTVAEMDLIAGISLGLQRRPRIRPSSWRGLQLLSTDPEPSRENM